MEEPTKICFKCGEEKPLSAFYKHPQMADGHVNKCKVCNKRDVAENYDKNLANEDYVEKERIRGREKYHRLYKNKHSAQFYHSDTKYKGLRKKYKDLVPGDCEIHHWNYNLIESFFILPKRTHSRIHAFIELDQDLKFFKLKSSGEFLDTFEKHREFIESNTAILAKYGCIVGTLNNESILAN